MKTYGFLGGFTLMEIMISVTIFGVVLFGIFQGMLEIQNSMRFETRMEVVEGGATRLMEQLGRDLRESSYAYVFAGDWSASKDAIGVSIDVARNYFSSNPFLGGAALVPGFSNENWGQCPNPICSWCNRQGQNGLTPFAPNAFLAQPVRNNPQALTPVVPPPSFSFSPLDARGRLYGDLAAGDTCPACGTILVAEAYFSGILLFSPRRPDNTFSYNAVGDEAQWESMIFYCPILNNQGVSEIRRYVFFASSININASLTDLLDFDDNGVIETPPMTDPDGTFVLDAEGETFGLVSSPGNGNRLQYNRWDTTAGRLFRIDVNRTTGIADVSVVGGLYGGGGVQQIPLRTQRYAMGISDFEVSTYINNPSWEVGGVFINPLGVAELQGVRVSFQIDRTFSLQTEPVETIQTTMVRPRN